MNRAILQRLTQDRVDDALALLVQNRWSGAYHMIGYALECALKACILRHLDDNGVIFKDKKYLEKLSKCWTHDLPQLLELTVLKIELAIDCASNPALDANWGAAKDWTEVSRYEQKTSQEAHELFKAITDAPNGVLPWIQPHW